MMWMEIFIFLQNLQSRHSNFIMNLTRNILITTIFSPLMAFGWEGDRDVAALHSQTQDIETHVPYQCLKVNAVGLGMLVGNISWEYRFAPRWSLALPFYFSGWNYFAENRKFRCLFFQPEFRYWLKSGEGRDWFVGLHLGTGFYNVALPDWDYRIQDYEGASPAFNAGVSIGYRHNLSQSGNWKMEYSLGAGYAYTHFDRWLNIPNGAHYNSESKHLLIIDQVNISVIYRLPDMKKQKGGGQ